MAATTEQAGKVIGDLGSSHHKYTNRLAEEKSPYLLQHAHNPVDWYPWGEDAFELARREDRPILLSVGYSTCHWCHVMERESFEDEATAKLMNEWFVNIKVDREERPDVDKVYMTYVQATSGGGGWPMNVFLTPDLNPFLGGTYFPPRDAFGRPSFKTVLKRVHQVWEEKKDELRTQSAETMQQLAQLTSPSGEGAEEDMGSVDAAATLDRCTAMLAARFDEQHGGFGGAPKFPRPAELNVLLMEHVRSAAIAGRVEAGKALHMATSTLQHMAAGGIWDHLGGGFHRYSVDEYWHVPHFEKMLYDNPQLVQTFLDAFALTRDVQYARTARGILDYIARDMTHPEGGLFSAEDADSLDKAGTKAEGAFYVWDAAEIDEVLGPDRGPVFESHYYVKPRGNVDLSPRSDPHNEFKGKNVLIQRQPLAETARQHGLSEEEAEKVLAKSRELLYARRAERPRPHLDDKVVTAWNGMGIGALALASRVLRSEDPPIQRNFPVEGKDPRVYMEAALRAAEFVRAQLWDESTGRLRRSFREGPSSVQAFADDYALLIQGLLHLTFAGAPVRWLDWALQLQATMDELFWDDATGGYFATATGDPSILLRLKEDYDGAEPAASSIAASNLFLLAAMTVPPAADRWAERGNQTIGAFSGRLREVALAMPQMCCSLYLRALGQPRQVIVAGRAGAPDTEALLDAVHAEYAPDKVVLLVDPTDQECIQFWRQHSPQAVEMVEAAGLKDGQPATVFICQNFTCQAPTREPERVRQLMRESRQGGVAWYPKPVPVDLGALGREQ